MRGEHVVERRERMEEFSLTIVHTQRVNNLQ
jgi:hypothetical protein